MDEVPSQPDRSSTLYIVQSVFLVLSGLCVLTRAFVKTFLVKQNTLDDYLIYASMAGYLAYGIMAIDGALNGATGKHFSVDYTMDQASRSLRNWYLCMVLYAPITMAIRASVCVLLLRLAQKKVHRWIVWVNLAILAAVSIAVFFILVLQCTPPSYFWEQVHGAQGRCRDKLMVTYSITVHSSISAASDWVLGLLPIALLWDVRINTRTKVVIALLLGMGVIAGVVLIVRIPYVTRLEPGLEFLYRSLDVALWSVLEPALGIMAACVATFRPLFQNWGFGWNSTRRTALSDRDYRLSGVKRPGGSFRPIPGQRCSGVSGSGRGRHAQRCVDEEQWPIPEHEINIKRTVEVEISAEGKGSSDDDAQQGTSTGGNGSFHGEPHAVGGISGATWSVREPDDVFTGATHSTAIHAYSL